MLTAIGAYQLHQVLKASDRLRQRGVEHTVVYLLEPRRFSEGRNEWELEFFVSPGIREVFYPPEARVRIFVTHTRSGRIQALLQAVDTGPHTLGLGYRNEGGTHDVDGMLFINHQSWAHVVDATAERLGIPREEVLAPEERDVLDGKLAPHGVVL